jgi:hypothetical protein
VSGLIHAATESAPVVAMLGAIGHVDKMVVFGLLRSGRDLIRGDLIRPAPVHQGTILRAGLLVSCSYLNTCQSFVAAELTSAAEPSSSPATAYQHPCAPAYTCENVK